MEQNMALTVPEQAVVYVPGAIDFPAYKKLLDDARQIAAFISSVEVTDDTVKASKKLLASVNKEVGKLESRRIEIKKALLEPYADFETQIKEITGTLKEADATVRSQVRELEERQREEKRQEIEALFTARMQMYTGFPFTLEDFLTPQHLNKSMSINKIEEELAAWFLAKDEDLRAIAAMEHAEEILTEYVSGSSLSAAMTTVRERHRRQEESRKTVAELNADMDTPQKATPLTVFTIQTEKDAAMVELFLENNKIEYTKEII